MRKFAGPFFVPVALAALLAGSACRRVVSFNVFSDTRSVTENRAIAATDYTAGSGIEVQTPAGSVDIESDPSLTEAKITAKVSAFGKTDEEARARLPEVKVNATQRADGVLVIGAEIPRAADGIKGQCSFVVRVPAANGVTIKTGNGSLAVKHLGGDANLTTGVGSITATGQGGGIEANSGNGSISITQAGGTVTAGASIGAVKIVDAHGNVTVTSGNGSIEVKNAGGDVKANTSVGSMSIHTVAGTVTATGGNGGITIAGATNAKAKTSVGSIKIENVGGEIEAESGNGSIVFHSAPDSDPLFKLETSVGSIGVHLHATATGSIEAGTSFGNVTINGSRKPESVTGENSSKKILLKETGPASRIHGGNGSITITLD